MFIGVFWFILIPSTSPSIPFDINGLRSRPGSLHVDFISMRSWSKYEKTHSDAIDRSLVQVSYNPSAHAPESGYCISVMLRLIKLPRLAYSLLVSNITLSLFLYCAATFFHHVPKSDAELMVWPLNRP